MSTNRPSLMDMDDFSSVGSGAKSGRKKAGGGGGIDSGKALKIALAGVLLLAAGGLYAWQFGLFSPDPGEQYRIPDERAKRIQQEIEEEDKERQKLLEQRKIIIGGA